MFQQGLVDLDVEIAKCDKKLDLAKLNLDKVLKVESQPDYEETVPATVRLQNEEKVCNYRFACEFSFLIPRDHPELQRRTLEAEVVN